MIEGGQLEGIESGVEPALGRRRKALGRSVVPARRAVDVGVVADRVVQLPSEELIAWQPENLALQVPKALLETGERGAA